MRFIYGQTLKGVIFFRFCIRYLLTTESNCAALARLDVLLALLRCVGEREVRKQASTHTHALIRQRAKRTSRGGCVMDGWANARVNQIGQHDKNLFESDASLR